MGSQEEDNQGNNEVEEDGLSEVDFQMIIDGVDLVHEELEPCPEQMYQSSFEASELANLYEPYSDRENVRYVDDINLM